VTMEPRQLRRRIRRTFRVRGWSWHSKVAIGAWIPAAIVAFALVTGPNRGTSADADARPAPTTSPTTFSPNPFVNPIQTPKTVPLEAVIGGWLRGARRTGRIPAYIRMGQKAPRILTTHPGTGKRRRR
jgi:hypothetical protein